MSSDQCHSLPLIAPHTTRIPPPPHPSPLLLIAKWERHQVTKTKTKSKAQKHWYSLVIRPDKAIEVGTIVRILATSQIAYIIPDAPLGELDTYDPHVVGQVDELRISEEDPTQALARVTNACRRNSVREVEVNVPMKFCSLGRSERDRGNVQADESSEHGTRNNTREGTDLLTCIRPTPVWRECVGKICWNHRRDLPILALCLD